MDILKMLAVSIQPAGKEAAIADDLFQAMDEWNSKVIASDNNDLLW